MEFITVKGYILTWNCKNITIRLYLLNQRLLIYSPNSSELRLKIGDKQLYVAKSNYPTLDTKEASGFSLKL